MLLRFSTCSFKDVQLAKGNIDIQCDIDNISDKIVLDVLETSNEFVEDCKDKEMSVDTSAQIEAFNENH